MYRLKISTTSWWYQEIPRYLNRTLMTRRLIRKVYRKMGVIVDRKTRNHWLWSRKAHKAAWSKAQTSSLEMMTRASHLNSDRTKRLLRIWLTVSPSTPNSTWSRASGPTTARGSSAWLKRVTRCSRSDNTVVWTSICCTREPLKENTSKHPR